MIFRAAIAFAWRAVSFDGNKYFSSDLLSRRLLLQTASFASSGRFSQQLLRADIDSIRGVYLSNGFRDAQVTSAVDDHYRGKKNNLFVVVSCRRGRAELASPALRIDGNHAISTDELLSVTGSTQGRALFGIGSRERPQQYSGALLQRRLSRGGLPRGSHSRRRIRTR